jgi:hypothetical protein
MSSKNCLVVEFAMSVDAVNTFSEIWPSSTFVRHWKEYISFFLRHILSPFSEAMTIRSFQRLFLPHSAKTIELDGVKTDRARE